MLLADVAWGSGAMCLSSGEKHVLLGAQLLLAALGSSGGASSGSVWLRLGFLWTRVFLAQFGSLLVLLSFGTAALFRGFSVLDHSTDLTNCLGSVLSCASSMGTAGLGLGLAGMRIAWLLCAS